MRRVVDEEFNAILPFFEQAGEVAKSATCLRAKCGSIIVKDGVVLGTGYNSPGLENDGQRYCEADMNLAAKPKYDKTCCIHAEWRAVLVACKNNPEAIIGSTLYFMRVDDDGKFTDAGDPFCTVCSRLALEAGVGEFALYNDGGADIYTLEEYNHKTYQAYVTIKV